jgi:hypothetical protein
MQNCLMLVSKYRSHTGSRPIVSTASFHKMVDVNNKKRFFRECIESVSPILPSVFGWKLH